MWCSHDCSESWQMPRQDCSWSPFKGYGSQERCLRTGRKWVLPGSSNKARRTWGTTSQSASAHSLGRWQSTAFGGHLFPHDDKKVLRSSQHGFTKGTSCLTSLTAFHDETTACQDEGRAVDIAYLDFSVVFNPASPSILIGKIRKCGLDEWSMKWIGNKLNKLNRSQSIVLRVSLKVCHSWCPTRFNNSRPWGKSTLLEALKH